MIAVDMEKPIDSTADLIASGRDLYFPPGTDVYSHFKYSPDPEKRHVARKELYFIYFDQEEKNIDLKKLQTKIVDEGTTSI